MGWKGTVRSMKAAYRASERDSQRRNRELQKRQKEFQKMQVLDQAQYEVEVYENRIDMLVSVHKEKGTAIDWRKIANTPKPKEPSRSNALETKANARLINFKPNIIHRIFGLEAKTHIKLTQAAVRAKEEDNIANEKAQKEWVEATNEWKLDTDFAKKIVSNEPKARLDAIKQFNPFSDISELGSMLTFSIGPSNILECTLSINSANVIPTEIKSLQKNGNLSLKKMPVSRFNELHQDYVCSCLLRVASETFCILPDEMIIVTATERMLNTSTGYMEQQPIVSAAIARKTLQQLNMQSVDPSDSLRNFIHNMNFKKTTGFSPIEAVDPEPIREKQ